MPPASLNQRRRRLRARTLRGRRPLAAAVQGAGGRGAARRGQSLSRLHGACRLLSPGGWPAPLPTGPAEPSRGGAGTCAGAGLKALGPDRSVVPANFRQGLLALWDSPLPGRDPAPGTALRRRRQAVLWFF